VARCLGQAILPGVGGGAAAQPDPTALGCGRPGAGVSSPPTRDQDGAPGSAVSSPSAVS